MAHTTDRPHTKVIPEFPNYGVSAEGKVFNLATGKEMRLSPTLHGDLTVGLVLHDPFTGEGQQYRRSVKVLVANAFVEGRTELFDTPILKDGDKYNLNANNIAWRPRWFAHKYSRQFLGEYPNWYFFGPIEEIIYKVAYRNVFEAAVLNGTLCMGIRLSILNEIRVFPTGEIYITKQSKQGLY